MAIKQTNQKYHFFLRKIKVKHFKPSPQKIKIFRTAQKHHGSVNSFDNENIEQSLPYLTFWGFYGFLDAQVRVLIILLIIRDAFKKKTVELGTLS